VAFSLRPRLPVVFGLGGAKRISRVLKTDSRRGTFVSASAFRPP
jgi:hypothetical protein